MLRLGAHLSIAKGLPKTAAMAAEIKANTFQYFTRNPRGGAARTIPADEIAAWQEVRKSLISTPSPVTCLTPSIWERRREGNRILPVWCFRKIP